MTSTLRRYLLILTALALPTAHADHHQHASHDAADNTRVLGKLTFPTSTESAEAQAAFEQGMLLLHLFEYPYAEAEFRRAQEIDPDFGMAYWGEAMTHNHPIWDQQAPDAARAVLNRFAPNAEARAARLATDKARDYFASLEILYGPAEGRAPKAERDLAYQRFLGDMAARYPDDHEVRLFHALAIMGTHAGVRDIPDYMESAALSQSVFYANRQHPGAAHYLIHAVDDPIHAPLGLEAARALYRMAPDAGHSLHMTTHIFNALGMWADSETANRNAARVANAMRAERGQPSRSTGHYNEWLLYALLQQGKQAEAKALLSAARAETKDLAPAASEDSLLGQYGSAGSMVWMWARYMIETGGNDPEVAAWQVNTGDALGPSLKVLYVNAMLSDDAGEIEKHLATFRELGSEVRERVDALPEAVPHYTLYLQRLDVIEQQLQASLARAEGDDEAALAFAREASRLEGEMPFSFGPPVVDYPSAQLVGEIALTLGRFDEAAAAFREQLQRSRRKVQAVEGLAKAERVAGM